MSKENKTNKGWHDKKDVLLGKAPMHHEVALKNKFEKEHISEEITITPADNEREETLTLHFKDSDKFVDAVFEFEEKHDTIIWLDFEVDRFVISVSTEMGDMFRNFMKEKDLQEIPEAREIDEIIAQVQNERSSRAINSEDCCFN
jgi:hypothetical protein